jgi:vacuole morphology and inheritance protein 14
LKQLFADVDIDVKNGAQLLDRLIKDVVSESDSFQLEKFIPLLRYDLIYFLACIDN